MDAQNPSNRIDELLTAIARGVLAPILEKELADHKVAQLFQLTGKANVRDAAKRLRMGKTTILAYWKKWEQLGILKKDGRQYRRVI